MTTAPHVPVPPPVSPPLPVSVPPPVSPPPRGPGVQPPFPAPPVEGKGRRVGLALGIGALVVLLVCGGGVAALIGLGTSMSGALRERAQGAVRDYLDAVRDQNFDRAYGLLCDQAQDDESSAEFRERVSAEPAITSYQLGELVLVSLSVPVALTYADGATADLEAYLDQDQDTGAFEVCEVAE